MSEFKEVVKEGASSVWRRTKQILLGLLLLGLVGGGIYVWVAGWTYSDGTRAGYLIKVSNKGVAFKTYEGQLNLGGFQTGDQGNGIVGNIWAFSVAKKDIYAQLQNLEGQKVKLYYRQRYKTFFWQGKTDYFVYKVEALE
ncbi:MAG: hypothetical protein KDC54_13385 [Lewinella sp.]|nr:hypothetical protein [Lewinella sp.]